MKTRIVERLVNSRVHHVVQTRRWRRWRDIPGMCYPSRMQAIAMKYRIDRSERTDLTHAS